MLSETLIPSPSHRHAAPSAPWPWVDIDDDQTLLDTDYPPIPEECNHRTCGSSCWKDYPRSRFPNWTDKQVKKSNIWNTIHDNANTKDCIIHHFDVNSKGIFETLASCSTANRDPESVWEEIVKSQLNDVRVRALFVENLSGNVLQMLGAKYNIEPFFFSSSLNWIPSRYQEDVRPTVGDHITITMTFLRSTVGNSSARISLVSEHTAVQGQHSEIHLPSYEVIDTKAPLDINVNGQKRQLIMDLLSLHVIRRKEGSIIISYHPSNENIRATEASYLQKRIGLAGRSVYWQRIFQKSPDSTLILLPFLWHALYAWDEALENLYTHICSFENEVLTTIDAASLNTQRLYKTRAHMLHYSSLLEDFRKTVDFIRVTHNPALDSPDVSDDLLKLSRTYMERECSKLVEEIARLEMGRSMQDKRLKNVMSLVFSSVSITDSKHMQEMTQATARDSAAMKQIAYLTMVFLPASFIATVFGMNVKEISPDTNETLFNYIATAIPMTVATIWIIFAFQIRNILSGPVTVWKRVGWPFFLAVKLLRKDTSTLEDSLLPFHNRNNATRIKHA